MNFETPALNLLTLDEKSAVVTNLFRRDEPAPTRPPAGVFNPTRMTLLKTFRLDEPIATGM